MNFSDLRLNRVILELRYDKGYLYWDRCGATIVEICKKFPEWKWKGVTVELASLKNIQRRMELVFNFWNIRFIQNKVENLNQFKEATDRITPFIVEKLEIEKFKRIGNRYQYVFPLKNPEQGKKIIQESSIIEIPKEKLALFTEKPTKAAFVVYLENENLRYRIELVGIERLEVPENIKIDEQFEPKYGLRIDIDIATLKEVKASNFDCGAFVQSNKKFLENNLIKLI